MDELTFRLIFGIAGLVVGLILGWTSRAAIDARAVRKAVTSDMDNTATPGSRRTWIPTRTDLVLWLLIVLSLISGFAAWRQYEHSHELTARVDRMATCTAEVLERQVEATNERTTFTEESARRNLELQNAEKAMLTGVLNPAATREQRRQAVENYVHALEAYQDVQAKAAKQRRAWPYPTQEEIDRCRT